MYLTCGLIGGAAQVAIDPGSHVPAIGASGAIAGILGGYIVTYPSATVQTLVPIGCLPLFFRLPAVLVIGLWAGVQFMHGWGAITERTLSEQGGGTAYFAHIGGFASGVILMPLFRRRKARRATGITDDASSGRSPRIGILGAGALGTLFGWHLGRRRRRDVPRRAARALPRRSSATAFGSKGKQPRAGAGLAPIRPRCSAPR